MLHPYHSSVCARYFYLPASKERNAEVIEVLNSDSDVVEVPMREEDVELRAFYERPLSEDELIRYRGTQTWKLFYSWEELQQDHTKLNLPEHVLQQLLQFKSLYELQEEMAA